MKLAGGGTTWQLPARLTAVAFLALSLQAAMNLALTPSTAPLAGTASVRPAGGSPAQLAADPAQIAARHLFGRADAAGHAPAPPRSRADLRLGGIWYASGGAAYVLLGESGKPQRPYRVGDRLPGGVELEEIQPDHVVLRRGGRAETLSLPRAGRPLSAPAGQAQRTHR